MLGVAAADIKHVVADQGHDAVQRPLHPAIPSLATNRAKGGNAYEFVVGLTLVQWMLITPSP